LAADSFYLIEQLRKPLAAPAVGEKSPYTHNALTDFQSNMNKARCSGGPGWEVLCWY
jgi:hypothetical protein